MEHRICFGGITVIELLRSGVLLRGVVTFHGLLGDSLQGKQAKTEPSAAKLYGAVLILHGHNDPLVSLQDIVNIQKEFTDAKLDLANASLWTYKSCFYHPKANNPQNGLIYNEKSSKRAWNSMRNFFEQVMDIRELTNEIKWLRRARIWINRHDGRSLLDISWRGSLSSLILGTACGALMIAAGLGMTRWSTACILLIFISDIFTDSILWIPLITLRKKLYQLVLWFIECGGTNFTSNCQRKETKRLNIHEFSRRYAARFYQYSSNPREVSAANGTWG